MSPANGYYIGTESCTNDVNHDAFDDINTEPASSPVMKKQSNNGRKKREKKESPPPIPLLAHHPHNLSSHMPWELKRYYTGDGRLILREEEPRHRRFFRAHRANGRLTLQVVPLDHMFPTDSPCLSARHHDIRHEHVQEVEADGFGEEGPSTVEAEGLPRATNCNLNFNRVSSATSSFFEMPAVHPIRTGHG